MKLLWIIPVLLSLILVAGISQADAEISTDKQEYHYGDTVVVSGIAELEPKELLEIYFTDPNGVRGFSDMSNGGEFEGFYEIFDHLDPHDAYYEYSDFFSEMGEYTIDVISVKSHLVDNERVYNPTNTFHETTTFQLTAKPQNLEHVAICREGDILRDDGVCVSEIPYDDAPTIQDKISELAQAEKRIDELVLENKALNLEISRLHGIIDSLQKETERLTTEFYDTILNQMQWFRENNKN